ncbi:hypothetical protein KDM41_07790 [bacterium]|nr:hypothetical protein [bacterium]
MLNRSVIGLGLALLFASTANGGELVTVPLDLGAPALYLDQGGVDLAFDASRALEDVTAVRLHVTGRYPSLRVVCWQDGNFAGAQEGDGDAGLVQALVADGTALGSAAYVFGATTDGSETFDLELEFVTPPAGWDFLAGGLGTLRLVGLGCVEFPAYPTVCLCEHSAVVESAALEIQLGSPVATARENWGAVKARYR